ncbi:MAG TPA: S8 family serine peptidase [Acidimicrobiales bacterium]|nr:S8 family serine peptidase [Acidimicrobiales bacterium]
MTRPRLSMAVVALAGLIGPLAPVPLAASTGDRAVIVMAPAAGDAADAVRAVGGDVGRTLESVSGVSALLSAGERAALERDGLAVVPDTTATVTSTGFDERGRLVQLDALDPATSGRTVGAGVGVALIDTGVAASPELDDRVIDGPDLSGEADGVDRYGHGTFMAGLIAGAETGAAPGAHVVSVKVAGADGETSLSQVLDAVDWVVEARDELDIRILSLSLAVPPFAAPHLDPLVIAADYATANGVLVVAAAGNEAGRVLSPGLAPSALTVGATDHHDTARLDDDTVAPWSGSAGSKPEVVAPGAPVISVRAPGSTIDREFPAARIGDEHFRGSGTSMATALTAGAAAVVAEQAPDATPAELKAMLVEGARQLDGGSRAVDLRGAEKAAATLTADAAGAEAEAEPGDGLVHWTGSRWAGSRWASTTWAGSRWAGSRWAGSRWAGSRWAGSRWAGSRWAGSRWAGSRWAGSRWAASDFASMS